MSFGALSEEAKVALGGAELAGTGICSGEGGMLPEEQQANRRYFYELGSAKFGYDEAQLDAESRPSTSRAARGRRPGPAGTCPATRTSARSPGASSRRASRRISRPPFRSLRPVEFRPLRRSRARGQRWHPDRFQAVGEARRGDIEFALAAVPDYIILDGRGGGTGAAPLIFRDNISVPTIPALARARATSMRSAAATLRSSSPGGCDPADFVKALALGADGVAVANAAMQAIGCVGARMCNTNNCPAGIATQKPELRTKLDVQVAADRLARFFGASVELMQVIARACGHDHLSQFEARDITTWKKEMAELSGVAFAGIGL